MSLAKSSSSKVPTFLTLILDSFTDVKILNFKNESMSTDFKLRIL